MRVNSKKEDTSKLEKEAAFKVKESLKFKEETMDDEEDDEFEKMTAFMSKNFKSKHGKYKGKLPFKCFNCGGVGHFASKCPKKTKGDEDDEDSSTQRKLNSKGKEQSHSRARGKAYYKRRSYMSKRHQEFSDEESDSTSRGVEDSSDEENLMLIKENFAHKEEESKEEDEGRVDLRLELESALKELDIRRKKTKRTILAMTDMQSLVEFS